MVRALMETWRVLKPLGNAVDLRPICVDVHLLILTETGWKSAGLVDRSQDRIHDVAANRAMWVVVHDGFYKKLNQKYFNVNYYWNDLKELKMDAEGCWKDDVLISKGIWRQARLLFKNGSGERRVRIPFRMKLTSYQKIFE